MNSLPTPTPQLSRKFNTPQLLNSGLYAVWGISLLLLILSALGINSQRQAIKTVGEDAAPSVLTAQQLRDSFADIDASLANELLLLPGQNQQALADFEKNQKKVADRLVAAAKNITYPNEELIVRDLQLKGSDYFLLLQEARDAHKRGDKAGALTAYRNAANLVDTEILPKAADLDKVNSSELESSYGQHGFTNGTLTFAIALVGLGLLALLVWMQLFIYLKMRRMLNLPLLGASAVALVYLGYLLLALLSANNNLKVAKEDAFESIHALRQARSLSYMANADESRYLLDAGNAGKHEAAFKQKIDKLASYPANKTLRELINSIPKSGDTKITLVGFSGFYAAQLNNITFAGELAQTVDTLTKLDEYLQIDAQIRQLYRSGKVAEAIALCTGYSQGQSNWAFERYKNANEKLRKLNEDVFTDNISRGFGALANLELLALVSIGSISILTLFGLRPRLREYL